MTLKAKVVIDVLAQKSVIDVVALISYVLGFCILVPYHNGLDLQYDLAPNGKVAFR